MISSAMLKQLCICAAAGGLGATSTVAVQKARPNKPRVMAVRKAPATRVPAAAPVAAAAGLAEACPPTLATAGGGAPLGDLAVAPIGLAGLPGNSGSVFNPIAFNQPFVSGPVGGGSVFPGGGGGGGGGGFPGGGGGVGPGEPGGTTSPAGTAPPGGPDGELVPQPVSGVPEVTSWAMMIAGFGVIGAGLRMRRTQTA